MKKKVGGAGLILIACMSVTLAWLAWRIVVETAAQTLAASQPGMALRLVSDETDALDQLAEQQIINPNGDLNAAKEWAEQALRANPLDDRALILLGLIAERSGDRKMSDAIVLTAGERSWRNPVTQLALFERDARRGEFAAALTHADALLRIRSEYERLIFPYLTGFAADQRTVRALADLIATNPPWRSLFLRQLPTILADESKLREFFAVLEKSANPPTKSELVNYVKRLVHDENFSDAYRVWLSTLPPPARQNQAHPYNADFSAPLDDMPFNWELRSTTGADVDTIKPDGSDQKTLRIQFSGARITEIGVGQLMLLAPGRYRFTGEVMTANLVTARGLRWSLSCAGKPAVELAQTDLISHTVRWTDFAVDFVVPTSGCEAQNLRLELPARIPTERRIEGEAFYRGLLIAPLPGEARQ